MSIACIIPTCNRPDMLREAIRSAVAQSMPPAEILIVNNGPAKPHGITQMTGTTIPVRCVDIPTRSGVAQARNFGAVMASSPWLAFLDDDDLWTPTYLERASAAMTRSIDAVVGRLDYIRHGVQGHGKEPGAFINVQNLFVRNPGITGSNLIIRRESLYRLGGYDPRLTPSEDKSLVLDLILAGGRVSSVVSAVACLRVHDGPRLSTNHRMMARGTEAFLAKYGHLMKLRQRQYVRGKIHHHLSRCTGSRLAKLGHDTYARVALKIGA